MSGWKKLASAAAAGGEVVTSDDLFAVNRHMADTNNTNQDIVNEIDLSTRGGAVFIKSPSETGSWHIYNTELGVEKYYLMPNSSGDIDATSGGAHTKGVISFNTDGFTLDGKSQVNRGTSGSGQHTFNTYTFAKHEKFFDIVEWTGTGNDTSFEVSHSLGCKPGMIFVMRTDSYYLDGVWTKGDGSNYSRTGMSLQSNQTAAVNWGSTETATFTDTSFRPRYVFNRSQQYMNQTGHSYRAFLWADNNSDGIFGQTGDQDIIKCGEYIGTGSSSGGPTITLGFEPSIVIIKRTFSSGLSDDWKILTEIDGLHHNIVRSNYVNGFSQQGTAILDDLWVITHDGFKIWNNTSSVNASGGRYFYMAIRRADQKPPTDATKVFDPVSTTIPSYQDLTPISTSVRRPDMVMYRQESAAQDQDYNVKTRIFDDGRRLEANQQTTLTNSGTTFALHMSRGTNQQYSYMVNDKWSSWQENVPSTSPIFYHFWQRAYGYFDMVRYVGNSTSNRAVPHGLGVTPEMIWIKCTTDGQSWVVDHKDLSSGYEVYLNSSAQQVQQSPATFGTHTDTTFRLVDGTEPKTNYTGQEFVAFLFASLDGISKVGSYVGTGSGSQTIDCGFSSGARFVMVKNRDDTGNWYVFDEARGIVAGNDPYLRINTTAGSTTGYDLIDPTNSGFIVNTVSPQNMNVSGQTYLFYAIA